MMILSSALRLVFRTVVITTVTLSVAYGQSTFGTIMGTVRDQSGAVVAGCVRNLFATRDGR